MGNDVGIEGYVYPHDRHTWIAKYGQKVVMSLLDCENSNLLAFNKKASATNAAFYCQTTLYNTIFDPGLPLPTELKVIEQKLVVKVGGEKKVTKAAAVAPEQRLEFVAGEAKETQIPRVKGVSSVKDKSREGIRSSFTDLNIYVVTWNMNGKAPGSNFADLLDVSGDHDFFIVGLQEAPNVDIKSPLSEVLGDKYCLIESAVLMSLQLFIFAKKFLKPFISGAKVDRIWEKPFSGYMGAQKGAAAVRVRFKEKSLLFITCHLARECLDRGKVDSVMLLTSGLLYAAHECNLETRNAQYSRICRNVFARSTSTWSCVQPTAVADEIDRKVLGVASNLVEDSDVVVWLGDLNYRLELPRCSVLSMLKSKMQELWANDQLSRALRKGHVFKGFQEGPLLFPPTYKYDVGTDDYDTSSKERVPSWTDRILYKVKTMKAELRGYDAISSLKTSDHRPVKAHLAFKNV